MIDHNTVGFCVLDTPKNTVRHEEHSIVYWSVLKITFSLTSVSYDENENTLMDSMKDKHQNRKRKKENMRNHGKTCKYENAKKGDDWRL